MDNKPSDEILKEVLALIQEIAEEAAGGNYLYRGEPEQYSKVSSSLYREFEEIESEHFDIAEVEKEIVSEAKSFTRETDDFEILTQLQHYGGKTNLIDFTTDYLIALFFACDGKIDEDGRVILLKQNDKYETKEPKNPVNRVIAQKSVFVNPPKGYVEDADFIAVTIPANVKKDMLEHLREHHGINTQTIYNDLHGYITNRKLHKSAYTEFYRGWTFSKRADENNTKDLYRRTIECFSEVIRLNPKLATAYYNRGIAKGKLDDHRGAIADYDKALSINPQFALAYNNRGNAKQELGDHHSAIADFDKAIALNPKDAMTYNNRGNVKHALGDHHGAIADFDKAIAINPKLAKIYNNRGNAKQALGNYQDAIADFDKAIAINQQLAEAYHNRGIAKQGMGDHVEANADMDKARVLKSQAAKRL